MIHFRKTPTTPVVIIGIGYDSVGNTVGIGFQPIRNRVGDVDFFTAEAPLYLTKFGLVQMSGSGNPFQLVTLTVVSYISLKATAAGHTYQPMFSIRKHRGTTDSITRYRKNSENL